MACVRRRRVGKGFRWVLDYRDQQGRRHWETTKGNRKEAERLLAERVRQISKGTYQAPTERVSFEDLAQAYLKHTEANVRETTFKDYRGNLIRHQNYGNLLNRGFYPALRRAGLRKIRFHDLRHTYVSLLIANGEHPKRIQALVGHSSINVTMDVYGHLMPGGGDEVADRLGALVFRGSGSKTVERDEIELAADAQAIVSIGGKSRSWTCDQGIGAT